jgi:hypothetical protein
VSPLVELANEAFVDLMRDARALVAWYEGAGCAAQVIAAFIVALAAIYAIKCFRPIMWLLFAACVAAVASTESMRDGVLEFARKIMG